MLLGIPLVRKWETRRYRCPVCESSIMIAAGGAGQHAQHPTKKTGTTRERGARLTHVRESARRQPHCRRAHQRTPHDQKVGMRLLHPRADLMHQGKNDQRRHRMADESRNDEDQGRENDEDAVQAHPFDFGRDGPGNGMQKSG